jgi:hypothetical protein
MGQGKENMQDRKAFITKRSKTLKSQGASDLLQELYELPFLAIKEENAEDEYPARCRGSKATSARLPSESLVFENLNFMAGGQLSECQLVKLKNEVNGKLAVIDTRQEPHAYVHGRPVTLFAPGIPNSKADANIMRPLENILISELQEQDKIEVNTVHWTQGEEYEVIDVKTFENGIEKQDALAKKHHVDYFRFYVYITPTPEQTNEFKKKIRQLQHKYGEDVIFYFQCWDGTGRSTTFELMYSILINDNHLSLDTIAKAHARNGALDIFLDPGKAHNEAMRWEERKKFILDYYNGINASQS